MTNFLSSNQHKSDMMMGMFCHRSVLWIESVRQQSPRTLK